jgi:hypothetical protein
LCSYLVLAPLLLACSAPDACAPSLALDRSSSELVESWAIGSAACIKLVTLLFRMVAL